MVVLGAVAVATILPVLFFLVFILGIPLTGLTIFLVQNGKLIAILVAVLIVYLLATRKK